YFKKTKTYHVPLEEVEHVPVANDIEADMAIKDFYEKLNNGIEELPERCRLVFTLSRKEQLSTKEIANLLNIAPKTVENQLTIAIRRLRSTLGQLFLL